MEPHEEIVAAAEVANFLVYFLTHNWVPGLPSDRLDAQRVLQKALYNLQYYRIDECVSAQLKLQS